MQLAQHTFLVTGGGSGLGAACVRRFADQGANVICADLNESTGPTLAKELGGKVRFVRTDVTDEAAVQQAVNLAVQTFGGLHGAVQCAGIALGDKILDKNSP